MPAASYREGPDGHSSRKQNSKRRRAKGSPSFVSGRVIGHDDISPRCIPECSAMALHRAVPPLLIPAAPELCLSCFWRGDALQFLPSAPFFLRGGRQLFGAGESRRSSMARSSRMRSRATGSGNILARCVLECLAVARFRRGAFPGGNPWQVLRSMHPESGLGRENRQFAARFARHASENGLALARYARHVFEKPRKQLFGNTPREDLAMKGPLSLHGPLESRTARRSCHPASPNRPSARNLGAAEQREPPELDRPTQETQPRRQRPPSPPGQQVPPAAPAALPPLFANTSQ